MHKNLRDDGQHNTSDDLIANMTSSKECEGHYIKLSVAPDGKNFTVSIPAHGHQRSSAAK